MSSARRRRPLVVAFLCLISVAGGAAQSPPQATDPVSSARTLARGGKRTEALTLLDARLAVNPGDLDARTLLGTVLLWEGRYDEARNALARVLAVDPEYIDALGALTYLELWSGNHARAEELAARVLARTPRDTSIMLARARALETLGRFDDARAVVEALLAVDDTMPEARQMRERLADGERRWKAAYSFGYDWFGDRRDPWYEQGLSVSRDNAWGSSVVSVWHADRFQTQDQQIEVDLYPRLRKGTYLYVNAGVSTRQRLYPDYRLGLDWYQSLGGGFEASIGYHYLDFGKGIDIYIASLSKYLGNWLLISQVFLVPDAIGPSSSYHAAVRRYLGDREYIGLRYKRGLSWEEARDVADVQVLDSQGLSGEVVTLIGRRVELTLRGSWERRERPIGDTIDHSSAVAKLGVRF